MTRGLLDTSVLIARESGRRLDVDALPDRSFVCSVTLGELEAGVLVATDTDTRARRMLTLGTIAGMAILPVDSAASSEWARMRARLTEAGRRANINDLWIAAVAAANDLTVFTQDGDFELLADLGLVEVIKV